MKARPLGFGVRVLIGIAIALVLIVVALVLLFDGWANRTFGTAPCTRTFSVPSTAMHPTLEVGDRVCADTDHYEKHAPADEEILVFTPPIRPGALPFVKRVVALPGDSLDMSGGVMRRNGRRIDEPYVSESAEYTLKVSNYTLYVDGIPIDRRRAVVPPKGVWQNPDRVPAGYYILLGDNRNNSDDSHLWGFLPRKQIIGRVTSIYWPLSRAKSLL